MEVSGGIPGAGSGQDVSSGANTGADGNSELEFEGTNGLDDESDSGELSENDESGDSQEKHRLKVDGKWEELTIDQLKAKASEAMASQRRFEQAAEKEKLANERVKLADQRTAQVANLIKTLRSSPDELAFAGEKLGHDMDAWAIKRAREIIQYRSMSDEEREAFDTKKERDALKAEKQTAEEKRAEQAYQVEVSQHRQRLLGDVVGALAEEGVEFKSKHASERALPLMERMLVLHSSKHTAHLSMREIYRIAKAQLQWTPASGTQEAPKVPAPQRKLGALANGNVQRRTPNPQTAEKKVAKDFWAAKDKQYNSER